MHTDVSFRLLISLSRLTKENMLQVLCSELATWQTVFAHRIRYYSIRTLYVRKRTYGITVTVTRMTRSTQALCILIRATEHSLGKLLLHVRGESNVRRYSRNVFTATSSFGLYH